MRVTIPPGNSRSDLRAGLLWGTHRRRNSPKRNNNSTTAVKIIVAVVDDGQGAAIGAGVGAGGGAGSEIITGGDHVKVPSETLLDFALQQDVSIPTRPS